MTIEEEIRELALTLRKYRERNQMTREEFCAIASQNPDYWGQIERGEQSLSLPKLLEVVHAHRINLMEVFPAQPCDEDTTKNKEIIRRKIQGYDNRKLGLIINFLDHVIDFM